MALATIIILLLTISNFFQEGQCEITIEVGSTNITLEPIGDEGINYRVSMDENNHAFETGDKTPLIKILNVPADVVPILQAIGSMFSYSLITETDASIYTLYALQSFDYETQIRSYNFNLDFGNSGLKVILFSVNNIDDEAPSLTPPQCEFDERTLYTVETSTCSCTVSDPDGWLSQMKFNIVASTNGEEDQIFSLDYEQVPTDTTYSALVYMAVNKELDYDAVTFYRFDIRATDGAGHSTTPNELVRAIVNVNDIRNNPPVWTSLLANEQFEEESIQTFQVVARDGDTGLDEKVYYMKTSEDDTEANYIAIDKETGTITVTNIDRDKDDISIYNVQLLAYIDEALEYSTPLTISFYIIDIDDNAPLVQWVLNTTDNQQIPLDEPKTVKMSFLENYTGSLKVATVIRDLDTGDNAQYNVELENLEDSTIDYTEAFMVVPTSGYRNGSFDVTVRDATYLDYEDSDWINIKFYVSSKGTKDPTKTDKVLMEITLIDYNDEFPIFAETEYKAEINETAKQGTSIITVCATDRDAEDTVLHHELVGSTHVTSILRIDPGTGEIFVNTDNAFDYDTVNPIFVQVRAIDKADHTATVALTITLLDVNNKAPTISPGVPIRVEENQVSEIVLSATITASDLDTTASLTARIDWDNSIARKNSRQLDMTDETISNQVEFLDVDFTTKDNSRDIDIVLTVNKKNTDNTTPDFELFDSLYLNLIVTDLNTDPDFLANKETTATILISIIDINDNTPYFPEMELSEDERTNRTVTEWARQLTSAGSISAIDLDVTDIVTYNCEASDEKFDWISVDSATGAFVVKENLAIDADSGPTYYFNYSCTATDGVHVSEPMVVRFYIIDTNDKVPNIIMDDTVYVDEKSDADTLVVKLEPTDQDRDPPFHAVQCSFKDNTDICANQFVIVSNEVRVRRGGNEIDRDTGLGSYSCIMSCMDNPLREQSNLSPNSIDKSFTIVLNDINDHTPALDMDDISVYENLLKDAQIAEITATDIDEDLNAEIVFSVSSVTKDGDSEDYSSLFDIKVNDDDYAINLTHKRAHLLATEDLKEHYGTYTINFGLTDKGTPPNSIIESRNLEIQKFNFESPRFVFPNTDKQAFILTTDQEVGSQLIQFSKSEPLPDFSATDNTEDVCQKWDIQLTMEQVSPVLSSIFTLASSDEKCSAQLQVNSRFDPNSVIDVPFELQLTARVKDGDPMSGEEPYFVTRTITINFLDSAQDPIFNMTEPAFDVFENDATQSYDLAYKAFYPIQSVDSDIYYFINTETETLKEIFAVDQTSGTISLLQEVDYETDEEFDFRIVASNNLRGTTSTNLSYQNIKINVIDLNDNIPQWTKEKYFSAIMPGYIRNMPILTVQATDLDKIDQDKLTYEITGDVIKNGTGLDNIQEPLFLMNEVTGEVRLNFQVDNTMFGYFKFDIQVSDVMDDYGNGPWHSVTSVTVFIITTDYTLNFRFYNPLAEVQEEEEKMLAVISGILDIDTYAQTIDKDTEDGKELDDHTYASLYFINGSLDSTEEDRTLYATQGGVALIDATTVMRMVTNINTYSQLSTQLRNETGLILLSFPSSTPTDNTEAVLRSALIGVSVVLGALCVILLITFILKTRQLTRTITNLTKPKFGSQESGLNRLGISVPTANKHAIEGSNPVFCVDDADKKGFADFDRRSINSGDSDLIGVEDNPEFDYNFINKNSNVNYM